MSAAYAFVALDRVHYNICQLTSPSTFLLNREEFTGEYDPETDSITDTMNGTCHFYLASPYTFLFPFLEIRLALTTNLHH